MKKIPFSEVQEDLSEYLDLAASEDVVITRDGKPVGVLIGIASEEDWVDYMLENDPEFQKRIASARKSLAEGKGVRLEDLEE